MAQKDFKKNNEPKGSPGIMCSKSPHFWWLISILGITIIGLITFILTERTADPEKIESFITWSASLLSITLSIFAIQYTYTSNTKIEAQFEKINAAASDIILCAKDLNDQRIKFSDKMSRISEILNQIDNRHKNMEKGIDYLKTLMPNLTNVSSMGISENIQNDIKGSIK